MYNSAFTFKTLLRQYDNHVFTHGNLTRSYEMGGLVSIVSETANFVKVRFQLYCERSRRRYHYSVETVMWDPGG